MSAIVSDIVRTLGGPALVPARSLGAAPGRSLRARPSLRLPHGRRRGIPHRRRATRRDPAHPGRARSPAARRSDGSRPEESDRLFRLGRIATLAEDVLGSRDKAAAWLHADNRALGGATPLSELDTDLGAEEVESVLLRARPRRHSASPVRVWRLCKSKHAAFDGEGARLAGGRWNRRGTAVVYASESLSLAALELLVHVDAALLPGRPRRRRGRDPGRRSRSRESKRRVSRAAGGAHPAPETLARLGTEWADSLAVRPCCRCRPPWCPASATSF